MLPSDVVSDIGQRMAEIKAEIAALEAMEPPEDYTVDTIRQWLTALKNNPDEKAVKLLIKRIDVSGDKNNNVFNIQSTLNTLLEIVVRVAIQHFLKNPVKSMVLEQPNSKITCITPISKQQINPNLLIIHNFQRMRSMH